MLQLLAMRYHYLDGVSDKKKSRKNKKFLALPLIVLFICVYVFAIYLAPSLPLQPPDRTAKKLVSSQPAEGDNRLYIPQINVDLAIKESESIDSFVNVAIHNSLGPGNPDSGGNFVLSANKFSFGLTPQETQARSPFFHLDKLQNGDELFVDWDGTRYVYKVKNKYSAKESGDKLELPSDNNKLTLYAQNLDGVAVEAEPAGVVAWNDGKPYVKQGQAN